MVQVEVLAELLNAELAFHEVFLSASHSRVVAPHQFLCGLVLAGKDNFCSHDLVLIVRVCASAYSGLRRVRTVYIRRKVALLVCLIYHVDLLDHTTAGAHLSPFVRLDD